MSDVNQYSILGYGLSRFSNVFLAIQAKTFPNSLRRSIVDYKRLAVAVLLFNVVQPVLQNQKHSSLFARVKKSFVLHLWLTIKLPNPTWESLIIFKHKLQINTSLPRT